MARDPANDGELGGGQGVAQGLRQGSRQRPAARHHGAPHGLHRLRHRRSWGTPGLDFANHELYVLAREKFYCFFCLFVSLPEKNMKDVFFSPSSSGE